MRGAGEHRLLAQLHALLARLQHPVAHLVRLRCFVAAEDQVRSRAVLTLAAQLLGERPRRLRGERVRHVEDRLGGAVVALQRDDRRVGEVGGELQDVLGGRGAPAVDGLQVIADGGDVAALAAQRADDLHLQPVDVLVLVDQQVVERTIHGAPDHLVPGQCAPVKEQVVEVKDSQRALAGGVGLEQRTHGVDVVLAPRKMLGDDIGQGQLGVDRARVDVQQRALLREAALALRVPMLLPDHVDQVRRVTRVEHPETGRQIKRRGVQAQEAVGHGVEGAADHAAGPRRHRDQGAGALEHLAGGPAGEREQHDALRRHSLGHQPGHPRAERGGLARAGAGQDQQGAAGMRRSGALLRIQPREPRACVGRRGDCARSEHAFGTLWREPDGADG